MGQKVIKRHTQKNEEKNDLKEKRAGKSDKIEQKLIN